MLRFLHAADIHLDSPLVGLDRYEGLPTRQLRLAGRKALENLVSVAIKKRVRFVILSGDLFDGDWPDANTGLFFIAQMARLKDRDIRVYVVTGNHDAANRMTRSLPYPKNVVLFASDQPQSHELSDVSVVLHGQSYPQADLRENLALKYPAQRPGLFNIGVLHTGLDGREGHARYAPCTPEDLLRLGYHYWALGHIHQRESVARKSRTLIEFPGNIQGRHIRETGPKGCLIVNVDSDYNMTTEFQPLDVCRWARVEVPCNEVEDTDELLEQVESALQDAVQDAEGRILVVRVVLTGPCSIHHFLLANQEAIRDDIRAKALDLDGDNLVIEKLEVRTKPAVGGLQSSTLAEDALTELDSLFEKASTDAQLLASVMSDDSLDKLKRMLPREIQPLIDELHNPGSATAKTVLDKARALLHVQLEEMEQEA